MKLPSIITLLLAASLVIFTASVQAGDPPPFAGEPHINTALKHLNAAKEKASTDAPGALTELDGAAESLAHASKNKGTYKNIAREYTASAIEYMKKGDVEKALHKIDEAIKAANDAGVLGKH